MMHVWARVCTCIYSRDSVVELAKCVLDINISPIDLIMEVCG